MTDRQQQELAKEIAQYIPTGRKWAVLRTIVVASITAVSSATAVTWAVSNERRDIYDGIKEAREACHGENTLQNQTISAMQKDIDKLNGAVFPPRGYAYKITAR